MTAKFDFPGMTPGPLRCAAIMEGGTKWEVYYKEKTIAIIEGECNARAFVAFPEILAYVKRLEAVREAAKRELSEKSETNPCHRTPCPCEEAIYTFCELRAAIAACEEVKP